MISASQGDFFRRQHAVALLTIAILCVVVLMLPWIWLAIGSLAMVCCILLVHVLAPALRGDCDPALLIWILIFPLGYHFLSFPRERPLFTLDRGVIALLLLCLVLAPQRIWPRINPTLRLSAVTWCCFLLAGALSLAGVQSSQGGVRTLVEAFFFPAVLGWYVVQNFRVRENLLKIHLLVCLLAIYLAAIGAAEMWRGEDLLPLPDAGLYYAGSAGLQLLRVNGPFLSNTSLALIGLITFFLLGFLKRATSAKTVSWGRGLHALGATSALLVALMPLFRSVVLTLLTVFLLESLQTRGSVRRVMLLTAVVCLVGVFLWGSAALPDIYDERVSSLENLYARIAQQQQSLELFWSHPLKGVGLNNFHDAAEKQTKYSTEFHGIEALDYPHSNLSAVLAETGILGFVPYLLAQILLVAAFWRIRQRGSGDSRLVWRYFRWIFLGYWLSGLNLTSGYYSDLNLWYVFSVALLYKYGVSESIAS